MRVSVYLCVQLQIKGYQWDAILEEIELVQILVETRKWTTPYSTKPTKLITQVKTF